MHTYSEEAMYVQYIYIVSIPMRTFYFMVVVICRSIIYVRMCKNI